MCGDMYSGILVFIGLAVVSIGIFVFFSDTGSKSTYRRMCKDLCLHSSYKEGMEMMKKVALYHGGMSLRSRFFPLSFFKNAIEKKNPRGDQIYHGVTRFNVIADLAVAYFLQDEKDITVKVNYVSDFTYGNPTIRMECSGYGKTIKRDIIMRSYNPDALEPDGNLDSVCMCVDAVKRAIKYLKGELKEEKTESLDIYYGYATWTK